MHARESAASGSRLHGALLDTRASAAFDWHLHGTMHARESAASGSRLHGALLDTRASAAFDWRLHCTFGSTPAGHPFDCDNTGMSSNLNQRCAYTHAHTQSGSRNASKECTPACKQTGVMHTTLAALGLVVYSRACAANPIRANGNRYEEFAPVHGKRLLLYPARGPPASWRALAPHGSA